MNIHEAAAILDGRQYRKEMDGSIQADLKRNGLVAVYGASDDLMEFSGAIFDEVGCCDGGFAYLGNDGLLENECEEDCPHFEKLKNNAFKIEAIWSQTIEGEEVSWTYKTSIPHATFKIMEDDDIYCIGIVFELSSLSEASQ